MKMLCVAGLFFASLGSLSAQNVAEFTRVKAEKPAIFQQLPSKFSLNVQAIDKLFSLKTRDKIVLPVDATHFFEGTLLEKVQRSDEVLSINITSSNFDGALLTLSKIVKPGESPRYTGRLVSIKSGDAFLITLQGTSLMFLKQKQSLLLAE